MNIIQCPLICNFWGENHERARNGLNRLSIFNEQLGINILEEGLQSAHFHKVELAHILI